MPKQFHVELVGKTPILLCGLPVDELIKGNKKKNSNFFVGNPNEWKETCYFDEIIGVYIPSPNVYKSILYASKLTILSGRKTYHSMIATTQILPSEIKLLNYGKGIEDLDTIESNKWIHRYPARIGSSNSKKTTPQLRYRTKLDEWSCEFNAYVSDEVKDEVFNKIVNNAGFYSGLGDWRPSSPNPGNFGSFEAKVTRIS